MRKLHMTERGWERCRAQDEANCPYGPQKTGFNHVGSIEEGQRAVSARDAKRAREAGFEGQLYSLGSYRLDAADADIAFVESIEQKIEAGENPNGARFTLNFVDPESSLVLRVRRNVTSTRDGLPRVSYELTAEPSGRELGELTPYSEPEDLQEDFDSSFRELRLAHDEMLKRHHTPTHGHMAGVEEWDEEAPERLHKRAWNLIAETEEKINPERDNDVNAFSKVRFVGHGRHLPADGVVDVDVDYGEMLTPGTVRRLIDNERHMVIMPSVDIRVHEKVDGANSEWWELRREEDEWQLDTSSAFEGVQSRRVRTPDELHSALGQYVYDSTGDGESARRRASYASRLMRTTEEALDDHAEDVRARLAKREAGRLEKQRRAQEREVLQLEREQKKGMFSKLFDMLG